MKKCILGWIILLMLGLAQAATAQEIGIISDIHAGSEKSVKKTATSHKMYPRKYATYFSKALSQMKAKGMKVVIVTGDYTSKDNNSSKYVKKIRDIAKKTGLQMVWARGNHDSTTNIRYLIDKDRYVVDTNSIRIIVLNSNERNPKAEGGLSDDQVKWFKEKVEETPKDKEIVVAMHHPFILGRNNQGSSGYQKFVEVLKAHTGQIKYVVAGHWHKDYRYTLGKTKLVVNEHLCSNKLHYTTITL